MPEMDTYMVVARIHYSCAVLRFSHGFLVIPKEIIFPVVVQCIDCVNVYPEIARIVSMARRYNVLCELVFKIYICGTLIIWYDHISVWAVVGWLLWKAVSIWVKDYSLSCQPVALQTFWTSFQKPHPAWSMGVEVQSSLRSSVWQPVV